VSRALEKVALEKGLQLHGPWLNKCIQLYETYLVRHGIMLVGWGLGVGAHVFWFRVRGWLVAGAWMRAPGSESLISASAEQ